MARMETVADEDEGSMSMDARVALVRIRTPAVGADVDDGHGVLALVRMKTTPAVGADVDDGHGVLALARMKSMPLYGSSCWHSYTPPGPAQHTRGISAGWLPHAHRPMGAGAGFLSSTNMEPTCLFEST